MLLHPSCFTWCSHGWMFFPSLQSPFHLLDAISDPSISPRSFSDLVSASYSFLHSRLPFYLSYFLSVDTTQTLSSSGVEIFAIFSFNCLELISFWLILQLKRLQYKGGMKSLIIGYSVSSKSKGKVRNHKNRDNNDIDINI